MAIKVVKVLDPSIDASKLRGRNVATDAPSDGDSLVWNGSASRWEPQAVSGGGGAPTGASYVTIGLNGSLTAERVLTAGSGLSLADGGANGNVTLSTSKALLEGVLTLGTGVVKSASGVLSASALAAGDITGALGFTPADQSRTITAGTGLTGGGDLSADRTLSTSKALLEGVLTLGTGVVKSASGVLSASALAAGDITGALGFTPADQSRTITAGTGLTGGGDLSADRTLSTSKALLEGVLTLGTGVVKSASGVLSASALAAGDIPDPAGDVTGTHAATVVSSIRGTLVHTASPTDGQVLQYVSANSRAEWTTPAGGGAPVGAQYVTLALDSTLTSERVLAVGQGISLVDGGANANVTLSWNGEFAEGTTTPKVFQTTLTTNTAPKDLEISPQQPFASSTGANRNPGNLVLNLGAPATGGSNSEVLARWGGTNRHALGFDGTNGYAAFDLSNNPATAGFLRVPGGATIPAVAIRNIANTANYSLAYLDASNNLFIGAPPTGFTRPAATFLDGVGGVNLRANGSNTVTTSASAVTIVPPLLTFPNTTINPRIDQGTRNTDAATQAFSVRAQNAWASATGTNRDGGTLLLEGGARSNTNGRRKGVQTWLAATDSLMIEVCDVQAEATAASRVVALCLGSAVTTTQMPTNTGDRVIYVANAAAVPSANPSGGGVLYAEGGALKWRGSSGTVTTIAPA